VTAWTTDDMPDLVGRTAIVTGANSGLGLVTARELARRGATVTMACRSLDRGRAAADAVRAALLGSTADQDVDIDIDVAAIDLASLESVRAFAATWIASHTTPIDILVNNAGVMAVPRSITVDGFERQFATNHLGHFALTGRLLDRFAPDARIVTVSSIVSRYGQLDIDRPGALRAEGSYDPRRAYARSKLANLVFAFELQRRAERAGHSLRSIAAHPGYAATELAANGPGSGTSAISTVVRRVMRAGEMLFAQSADAGALPQLYAATAPDAVGGSFIGPGGMGGLRGAPVTVVPSAAALDEETARRLWTLSEAFTGVTYLD
jgi:NAD(P)-dependent dehydrogenase (short-subunit alcohol dehydrogenase family)